MPGCCCRPRWPAGWVWPSCSNGHVNLGRSAGRAHVADKSLTLIMSALAGGDCIDDVDALRAGATAAVLGHRVAAPSTVGTFLRAFSWGHARQLDVVGGELLRRAWATAAGPGHGPLTIAQPLQLRGVRAFSELPGYTGPPTCPPFGLWTRRELFVHDAGDWVDVQPHTPTRELSRSAARLARFRLNGGRQPVADRSAIEWTDATWNPITGCSKVSSGCAYCYARP